MADNAQDPSPSDATTGASASQQTGPGGAESAQTDGGMSTAMQATSSASRVKSSGAATPEQSATAEATAPPSPSEARVSQQTVESGQTDVPGTSTGSQTASRAQTSTASPVASEQSGTVDASPSDAKAGTSLASRSPGSSPKSTHSKTGETPRPSPSPSRVVAPSHRRKRTKLGDLDLNTAKIGFIGAGKMAECTISGLIHYAKISPGRIHVAAPTSKGLERLKALGCHVTKRNYDIFGRYDCDIIFLCFHGYVIKHCYKLGGARPHPLTTNYIPHQRHPIYILSLVSGVSLSQIKACLLNPDSTSRYTLEIHRIMMNTAVSHGLGICAVDCEPDSRKLSAPLRQLLSSISHLEHVPASQMDAACAIGGSGLAFAYYFINALADGAFKMGLSRQQAIRFASKTAQCAAQTMLESGKHPAELRDNVSSPSGAAIYGIHVLEKNDVASGVTAAVEAAHKRAHDLANQEVS